MVNIYSFTPVLTRFYLLFELFGIFTLNKRVVNYFNFNLKIQLANNIGAKIQTFYINSNES